MHRNTLYNDDSASERLAISVAEKTVALSEFLGEISRDFQPVALASSLSAEDQILTDLIYRESLPIEIFTIDTGRLPAETYELMEEVERRYERKTTLYFPRHEDVEKYVQTFGINGFRGSVESRRACCALRKVAPLRRALEGRKAWITGLRSEQSVTRKGLPKMTYDTVNDLVKFSPLAEWREQEIWAYIRSHQVPYNKLYERNYSSIGCAPCTRAVQPGEDLRAGRWWWESAEHKECGLHLQEKETQR